MPVDSPQPQQKPISPHIHRTPDDAGRAVAGQISALLRERARAGSHAVIGFATGSTPLPLYKHLIRLHQEEGLSFSNLISFNLDEYLGISASDPRSYHSFMWSNLFSHIDVTPEAIHIPRGDMPSADIDDHCRDYEAKVIAAGGIDFQILGIGRTGHIGFNEPGSPITSRTRRIHLDEVTRNDAAAAFGGLANVPTHAITMGCGTILEARKIALLAWGRSKADVIAKAIHGPLTSDLPASYLQTHRDCSFHLDEQSAALL